MGAMLARLAVALPGAAVFAALGWLLGRFFSDPAGASVAALTCAAFGGAVTLLPATRRTAVRRLLLLAALLLGVLAASLFTFGERGGPAGWPAGLQLGLTTTAAIAMAFAALILRPHVVPQVPHDDPEITLEIMAIDPATTVVTAPPPHTPPGLVYAGVALAVLLAFAALFWLRGGSADAIAGVVTLQPNAAALGAGSAVTFESPASLPAPTPEVTAEEAAPAPTPPRATPTRPLVASAARRECMAQIESARLFLQLARQADNEAGYSLATEPQIDRMLQARPVGPRTLARIAERMWQQRDAPERSAEWWSSQFTRCEEARTSGNWYVVQG
jgi:hypothetical protein